MSGGLRELRAAQQLEDVTLVVEGGELKAHRVVLASCSPFFRRILVSCSHQAPLLYLRGVPKQELASMLDFMYQGEVSIGQDRLAAFLAVAEDLQVKGLTNSGDFYNNIIDNLTPRQILKIPRRAQVLPRLTDEKCTSRHQVPAPHPVFREAARKQGLPPRCKALPCLPLP